MDSFIELYYDEYPKVKKQIIKCMENNCGQENEKCTLYAAFK